jgi:hypothetical protein
MSPGIRYSDVICGMGKVTGNASITAYSRNHCCSGNRISIIYSACGCVCVLALLSCVQHTTLLLQAPLHFPHSLTNGTNLDKILNLKCVF